MPNSNPLNRIGQLWAWVPRNPQKGSNLPRTVGEWEDQVEFDHRNEWLRIEKIGFYGRWVSSPSGRWLLVHGQIHDATAHSWSSDDPIGAVILFDHGRQACRLDGLCRPETVVVCDAGVFLIYEWGSSADLLKPSCQMRVFTPEGKCLFRQRLGAVIELPALSSDASYLAFHTLAAPGDSLRPDDGESVYLVDLPNRQILWQQPVPVIWPTCISFDEMARQVLVHGKSGEVFRYAYTGEFLDGDAAERRELRQALDDEYGYQLLDLAQSRLDEIHCGVRSAEETHEFEDLIRKALAKKMSPNTKAVAQRILGEIAEGRGDITAAIKEYRIALALNNEIGLRKRVKSLEATIDRKESC